MWLILNGEGVLERYDSAGSLEVSVPLEAPEMEQVWAACVARAKATIGDQRRITGLSYVHDATVVGQTLWVLLNTEGQAAVMLAFAPDGQIRRRVVFSSVWGAHKFAFDRARGRILFTVPSRAKTLPW